jgi:hypothetical protein
MWLFVLPKYAFTRKTYPLSLANCGCLIRCREGLSQTICTIFEGDNFYRTQTA